MTHDNLSDHEKLNAFYRQGCLSLTTHPDRMAYGGTGYAAAVAGFGVQGLRDARTFARLVGPEHEFRKLIDQAEASGTRFGKSFAVALLPAPRKAWLKLITEAGLGEWSSKELGRQVRGRYSRAANRKRHRVGRLPAAIKTQQGLLMAMLQFCHRGALLLDDRASDDRDRARLPSDLAPDAVRLRSALAKFAAKLHARSAG